MRENDPYYFWNQIDKANSNQTLKSLCERAGLNYSNIKNQRSLNRLPKLEDAHALSRELGVTLEYLLTGVETQNLSPEAREVESSPELRALVRAVLRDKSLIQIISAIVESSEAHIG